MRVLLATAASLAVFAGLAAAVVLAPSPGHDVRPTVLERPAAGEVVPALLDGGEPVFVVAHRAEDGGGVSVVGAINPHLDILVVWCASDRYFHEPGPASRFDEEGTYAGGPAAEGLPTFDVTVDPDRPGIVEVGARRRPLGREHPPLAPSGPACDWEVEPADGGPGVERVLGAGGHDVAALYGPVLAPEDADRWSGAWGRFAGRVSTDGHGRRRVCSPRDEPGCPHDATPVLSMYAEDQRRFARWWTCEGDVDGEVLAEVTPAGFAGVAVMPPFAGVGVAEYGEGRGYHDISAQQCRPAWAAEGEPGQLAGTLVAVAEEQRDGETVVVAILDEPVRPVIDDGRRHPLEGIEASDRWAFTPVATVHDHSIDLHLPVRGRRMPKTVYRPGELDRLLEERGPLPVELTVDGGGRITSGSIPWLPD